LGPDDIALSYRAHAQLCHAHSRLCYRCSMNELAWARPDDTQSPISRTMCKAPSGRHPSTRPILLAGAWSWRTVLPMSTCWYSRRLWLRRVLPYKRGPQAQNAMPPVEIYTTHYCPFCYAAKALLRRKGVNYSEIDVGRDWARREEMIQRANGRMTVPQIFIGMVHVGGSDELHALERVGKLDLLLAGDEASA
jgi:glutaredoxin 3